jgi:ABC-type sugar transport system ATPase subunit
VVLETRDLVPAGGGAPVSINVRRGEIVGLAGLVGAGRTELARAIVGADSTQSGAVLLDGGHDGLGHAPPSGRGMAFVPENRKDQGVMPCPSWQPGHHGVAAPGPGPLVVPRRGGAWQRRWSRLSIVARTVDHRPSPERGNQQRRIGKWLARDRILYVLDEPPAALTSPPDTPYELMEAIAARGRGLMFSSDLPEIVSMNDRIYVMQLGTVLPIARTPPSSRPR